MAEAFDPDKYLKEKGVTAAKQTLRDSPALDQGVGGFDPDTYLAEKTGSPIKAESWLDTKLPWGTARGTIQGAANALPTAGMVAGGAGGGLLGGLAGGMGAIPGGVIGAGLGAGAGESLKGMIESGLLGKERTRGEVWNDPVEAIADGMVGEMGGVALGKGLQKAMSAGGKAIYKSGLKRIDQEVAKYGKEPVSDLLMKNDIAGSSRQVFDKMQVLGDKILGERNDVLREATRKGAEVDVSKSLAEARAYVDKLKKTDNPELKKAVKVLQDRINQYASKGAKESADVLRELPFTKPVQGRYGLVERNIPDVATVIDQTERVAGPTPEQVSAWKSSSAANVGKKGWQELAMSPEGKRFDKALSGGLRLGTEESVGRALGPDYATQLSTKNDELGRILSSRDRALMDAEQAQRRNSFSSVDGMIAGAGNPVMLAVKKAADLAKMTGPRTLIGRSVHKAGEGELMRAIRDNPEVQGLLFKWLLKKKKGLVNEGLLDSPDNHLTEGYEQ